MTLQKPRRWLVTLEVATLKTKDNVVRILSEW